MKKVFLSIFTLLALGACSQKYDLNAVDSDFKGNGVPVDLPQDNSGTPEPPTNVVETPPVLDPSEPPSGSPENCVKVKVRKFCRVNVDSPNIALSYNILKHKNKKNDDVKSHKVLVCHNLDNNPHEIIISRSALDAHTAHGDKVGPCEQEEDGEDLEKSCKKHRYELCGEIEKCKKKKDSCNGDDDDDGDDDE